MDPVSTSFTENENAPRVLKLTLIGRSLFSFEVATLGKNANALLDLEFIKGLCNEQEKLSKSFNSYFVASLFLSWVLFSENLDFRQVSIPLLGITLPEGFVTKLMLLLLLGGVFTQAMTKFISLALIAGIAEKAGQSHFDDAWRMYTAKYYGANLWVDILVPRFYGYSSTKSHWLFALLVFCIGILYLLSAVAFVNIASLSVFQELWRAANNWIEVILAIAAIVLIVGPTLATFIAIFVPFKFQFKRES